MADFRAIAQASGKNQMGDSQISQMMRSRHDGDPQRPYWIHDKKSLVKQSGMVSKGPIELRLGYEQARGQYRSIPAEAHHRHWSRWCTRPVPSDEIKEHYATFEEWKNRQQHSYYYPSIYGASEKVWPGETDHSFTRYGHFDWWNSQGPEKKPHFNWWARGHHEMNQTYFQPARSSSTPPSPTRWLQYQKYSGAIPRLPLESDMVPRFGTIPSSPLSRSNSADRISALGKTR